MSPRQCSGDPEALQQASDEQLLLNLVRLRYMEMPVFLQTSNINTQFAVRSDLAASGTINEGNIPNVLGLSAGLGFEERPAISCGLPNSRDFPGRLLAPIGANQLGLLLSCTGAPGRRRDKSRQTTPPA